MNIAKIVGSHVNPSISYKDCEKFAPLTPDKHELFRSNVVSSLYLANKEAKLRR